MTLTQSQSDKRYEKKVRDKLHAELRAFVEERRKGERSPVEDPFTEGLGLSEGSSTRPLTFAPWWTK